MYALGSVSKRAVLKAEAWKEIEAKVLDILRW